jgi:hypothetical protein
MILAAKMSSQHWLPCFKFTSCTLYVALLCCDTTKLPM